MLSFLIPENSALDRVKCMKIALIHDLAESIVGDITVWKSFDPLSFSSYCQFFFPPVALLRH
jgi:hypothetical protein